ncbi:MAG: asparagine synthase (glutamine-hydrolyzing) [Lachnospiraceae bacterium]|nr:asparagine synthase (glutamine-hydrolyzing) [Lachnospiraceae bacterium]
MCGIAGFCNTHMNTDAKRAAILAMNERMIHRGPDSGDCYIDESGSVVFGHRRLSIRDLTESGSQPMRSHNDRYVMIYNGEIYNASEIKESLKKDVPDTEWRGTSDTEILLEAIAQYGMDKALTLTKGMFALAVYDRDTGSIEFARDRVGEKPLYYGHVHGDLVFASDLDVIRAYPGFDNDIDGVALNEYLRYGFIPAPKTVYKDIFKLVPGTVLKFDKPYPEGKSRPYYDLCNEYVKGCTEGRFKGSVIEAVDALEETLKAAVKSQLVSDVPIGAFLSGGIDSSVCVALMQSVCKDPVKTFTIGFEDEKYDESKDSAKIAAHLGTDHTCLTISEKELIDVVPHMAEIFTEPFADSSQIPTYLVSKLAKSKVTVSISGDAGDELFAGYNTYWKTAGLYNKLKPIPGFARIPVGRMLSGSNNNTLYRSAHCMQSKNIAELHESVCYDMTRMTRDLTGDRLAYEQEYILGEQIRNGSADITDEMMLRDMLRYHPDDILVKVDRAGMAVSLENRVPMLDKDVLDLAFSLPAEYKLRKGEDGNLISKYVLKEVLYRYVPKDIMDRPKKGFSVPLKNWLQKGPVHDFAWDILTGSKLSTDGYIDKAGLDKLMRRFMESGENASLLWSVFVLEQWYRRYE